MNGSRLHLAARILFRCAHNGTEWPKGWKVVWINYRPRGYWASTCFTKKQIRVSRELQGMPHSLADALFHEFAHMLIGNASHGKAFVKRMREMQQRIHTEKLYIWLRDI